MDANRTGIENNITAGQELKKPGISQTGILLSTVVSLIILIGYRVQAREFYSGLLITEFGLIMLPALLFLLAFRFDLKAVLRLNGVRLLNFPIIFFLMLFAIPLAGVFNIVNLMLVNSIFGRVALQQLPVAQNGRELLISILVIAGSAGLCEEFLFRGVIQRGFERFGAVRSILLTAFLFSLMHMDFQKIFGTFALGAIIGFVVYKTDSLFCGIFAHFTNNAMAVLISYAATELMRIFESSGFKVTEQTDMSEIFPSIYDIPPQQLIIALFVYGFIFLFVIAIFVLLLYALIRINRNRAIRQGQAEFTGGAPIYTASVTAGSVRSRARGLLWLLPGILLIAGIYYLEVCNLTGAENEFLNAARILLGV